MEYEGALLRAPQRIFMGRHRHDTLTHAASPADLLSHGGWRQCSLCKLCSRRSRPKAGLRAAVDAVRPAAVGLAASTYTSSFFSGEGFVTRFQGPGTIYVQTRSLKVGRCPVRNFVWHCSGQTRCAIFTSEHCTQQKARLASLPMSTRTSVGFFRVLKSSRCQDFSRGSSCLPVHERKWRRACAAVPTCLRCSL